MEKEDPRYQLPGNGLPHEEISLVQVGTAGWKAGLVGRVGLLELSDPGCASGLAKLRS